MLARKSHGCCCYTPRPASPVALRTLAPGLTREFAVAHDAAVFDTFSAVLCAEKRSSLPLAASRVAQLALRHGGRGLRSAALHTQAAFWASWADALTVLSVRKAPFLQGLAPGSGTRNLSAGTPIRRLLEATDVLVAAGFPVWADLSQHAPMQPTDDAEFVRLLARARARTALPLQRSATIGGRWSGLLSVAVERAFAASLLSLPISNTANVDGEPPCSATSSLTSPGHLPLPFAWPGVSV